MIRVSVSRAALWSTVVLILGVAAFTLDAVYQIKTNHLYHTPQWVIELMKAGLQGACGTGTLYGLRKLRKAINEKKSKSVALPLPPSDAERAAGDGGGEEKKDP